MADIFDEVSEDLRQDRILQVWKKYSKFIIALITLIILFVFGYQGYNSWNKNQLNKNSEYFFNVLDKLEGKEFKKSIELFLNSPFKDAKGYSMLSNFGIAEANYKNNNIEKMILNYKLIYEDDNIDDYYQYLARFLSVMKDNKSSFQQLQNRLKPILNSPNKLQTLAAELEIMLFLNFDMIKQAKDSLKLLINRKNISFEQKNRLILINKIYDNND